MVDHTHKRGHTASVEVSSDTLTFPPETIDPGEPANEPANPAAMAPPKYRTGAILVSANYAQDKVFLRRITGVTQGINGTTRTSCGTVTDGLNFAHGNESDSRNCARAVSQWESSPNYPAIPSSVSDIDGVSVLNAGGVDRIVCRDQKRYWADSTVIMPLPHEIAWAQGNCGGSLKSFDLVTGFEPALAVDNVSTRAEAQASASRDTERMCDGCELSKSKTFFIGWFPVVVKLQGEVIGKAYDVSVEGRMDAGIRDVRLGIDLDLELHYDRENGPVSSRSSWNMIADVSPIVEGEWYAEAAERGHAEHQIAGLRTSLYFYDLAGPYFIPADPYGRAEAQLATQSAQIEGETCHLGLTAGFRTSAGLAGKIPLTNSEPVAWELFSYDSCGVDLAQNSEETRLSKSFLERESSLCMKKCLSVTPLHVTLIWDQNQDIDLKVTDPEGRVIDRNWGTDEEGATFANHQGCQRSAASTCFGEGGTGNREIVSWTARTCRRHLHCGGQELRRAVRRL